MTTMRYGIILVFTLAAIINEAIGLVCWKCVSDDCQNNPVNNYKAKKMKCKVGESCMKVRYRMYDNNTAYDSVIRTCSSGHCDQSTTQQFDACVKAKQYMVLGCAHRSCCSDTDLCNISEKNVPRPFLYFSIFILTILYNITQNHFL